MTNIIEVLAESAGRSALNQPSLPPADTPRKTGIDAFPPPATVMTWI